MSASGKTDDTPEEFRFECTRCGYCCTHEPGYVFLSRLDVDNLLAHLKFDEKSFLLKYCIMVHYGWETRISLTEKKNHDCIFWNSSEGCSVYSARPIQCRTYPVWPSLIDSRVNWEEEAKRCPGMNKGPVLDKTEIEKRLMLRKDNPFLDNT